MSVLLVKTRFVIGSHIRNSVVLYILKSKVIGFNPYRAIKVQENTKGILTKNAHVQVGVKFKGHFTNRIV